MTRPLFSGSATGPDFIMDNICVLVLPPAPDPGQVFRKSPGIGCDNERVKTSVIGAICPIACLRPYPEQILRGLFHVPVRIVHALVVKIRCQLFYDKIENHASRKIADLFFTFG